jgi:hypothetical protein
VVNLVNDLSRFRAAKTFFFRITAFLLPEPKSRQPNGRREKISCFPDFFDSRFYNPGDMQASFTSSSKNKNGQEANQNHEKRLIKTQTLASIA